MGNKVWARLNGETIIELVTLPEAWIPGTDVPAIWTDDVTTLAHVTVGWVNGADGSFAAPAVTIAPADLVSYAQAKQRIMLSIGGTVNVAASGQPAVNVLCDGTSPTRADLALLAQFGQQNPAGTKTWLDNKGVATTLTGSQLVALATAMGTWIDSAYATLGTVLQGIAASPPTVATYADVDAAFAADKVS